MGTLATPGTAMRHTHMDGEIATATIPTSTFTIRGKGITTKGIILSSITVVVAASVGMRAVASTVEAAVFTAVVASVAEAMAAAVVVAVIVETFF
jgi:hypothetical protein